MESESDRPSTTSATAAHQLTALSQAQLVTHTRYPVLGPWYPPTFAGVAAIFVAAYAAPLWLTIPIWFVVLAAIGAGTRWYLDKRGVFPSARSAPGAIRREMTVFFIGYGASIIAIVAIYAAVSWWAAALTTFVLFTVLITVYEARYLRAARRLEAEAGIMAPTHDAS